MDNDRRHEKSWNDPPMFSVEQLNKASGSVPLNKRYRYPQAPVQAPNQMYQQQQQQPNMGMTGGYGYQQPANNPQLSYGQPQQQQYPGAFSPYGPDPNANAVRAVPNASGYQAPPPPLPNVSQHQAQQYPQPQYAPSQPPAIAPNAYPAGAYGGGNLPSNQPSQINYNTGQYGGNPASNYNVASQYGGQQQQQQPLTEPAPPQMNYQSQVPPYNSQGRY
ncbi:PREDICTED: ribonucleoprotein RB97D-like [Rhagoletis zephyria]|uniref:ribonucleoprotein RB97D-like n=1 Tax=Rhagoletis zephyria TaxID=28612 RepID=UPI000811861C|nr:PREDICTED: ribonucleoprotein RB97D-like [Rhagoletis zephyria]